MKISQHCESLLLKAAVFDPLYGNRLANHLPMALIALDGLGADSARLSQFFESSSLKLEALKQGLNKSPIKSLKERFGDNESFIDYLVFFQQELHSSGREQLLKQILPGLIPGMSASAFHAVIRLAYALEAENNNEIVMALAYWASNYQALPTSTEKVDESLDRIMERLAPLFTNHQFAPGIIIDRMVEVSRLLHQQNKAVQPLHLSFEDIVSFCISAFAKQDNFTLLHAVTGCHAFRLLAPFVEDLDGALRYLWQSIAIAYMSTGLGYSGGKPNLPVPEKTWDKIKVIACKSSNDHVIKLVYTCWKEERVYNNPLYQQAAERIIAA